MWMGITICIFFIKLLFYKSGRLDLEDTFGSVIWRDRMNISDNIVLDSKQIDVNYLNKPIKFSLANYSNLTYETILYDVFPNAIRKEIEKFIENVKQRKIILQERKRK